MDWRMVTDRAACPYQSAKPRWTDPAASSDGKPVARPATTRVPWEDQELDLALILVVLPAAQPCAYFYTCTDGNSGKLKGAKHLQKLAVFLSVFRVFISI